MTDLVIMGTGGFARETHQLVEDMVADGATWNFLGFLDDNVDRHGSQVHQTPVLGSLNWLADHPSVAVAIGIGNSAVRRRVALRVRAQGANAFVSLRHPLAWVGNRVEIGEGALLCAGARITTDIVLGRHVLLNLDCTIGHDSIIGDYVTLAPGANISGAVTIGEGCELGTNCAVLQGLSIGEWTIIGASAVVTRELAANVTAVGMPARAIKQRGAGWQE